MKRFDKLIDVTPNRPNGNTPTRAQARPVMAFAVPFFAGTICADIHIYDGWISVLAVLAVITIAVLWHAEILKRWRKKLETRQ